MPGTNVTTAVRGASSGVRAPSGQLFIVGLAERGAVGKAVRLNGMADYLDQFGRRVSYGTLYDQLKTFFEDGGEQAWVSRVVGATATTGTSQFNDRAASPAPTLRIDAASPGAWSSDAKVEIRDGALPNTFRILVTVGGVVVDDRQNLGSPEAAVLAFANSPFIRVTTLGSSAVAPANNPAVAAPTALSAGNDQRATIVAADYLAGLSAFILGLGDGAVAIPGQTDGVYAGLLKHATENRRVALFGAPKAATKSDLKAIVAQYDSDAYALCAPWIRVTDEASGFRSISPEGYVAAMRSRAHQEAGPWRAPAGEIAASRTILGLEVEYQRADGDELDAAHVSVIRNIAGSYRLYGWRSGSSDEANFTFLSARDLLNRLVTEGEKRLEQFVFQPIDAKGQLLSSVNATLVGMVEPIARLNGLFANIDPQTGEEIDPGYRVETGSAVNSIASLANNEIKARLSVRAAPTGALVSLIITKVGVLSGL